MHVHVCVPSSHFLGVMGQQREGTAMLLCPQAWGVALDQKATGQCTYSRHPIPEDKGNGGVEPGDCLGCLPDPIAERHLGQTLL